MPLAKDNTPLPLACCGFGSPALDFAEPPLSLDDVTCLRQPSTFLMRAVGDSMTGLGIYPGDVLVIDKARTPGDGDIVVAVVGEGFLVKQLRLVPTPSLHSANAAYPPLVIGEDNPLEVWGVCTWNLHALLGKCGVS
ncbi:S24 family peptidase [Vreelandella rituensis]|uniref:DNA polymerase V subunit UmuD n=1 Tax=Vreelandella rituensis TaxID=2282306 RepID=A0A368UBN5_9GAMM|nr:S24 family peptidase [Halomonas rituensis]RCV93802.1 DNA polymerase V subunit UmuD [Halomonas rituensis]